MRLRHASLGIALILAITWHICRVHVFGLHVSSTEVLLGLTVGSHAQTVAVALNGLVTVVVDFRMLPLQIDISSRYAWFVARHEI